MGVGWGGPGTCNAHPYTCIYIYYYVSYYAPVGSTWCEICIVIAFLLEICKPQMPPQGCWKASRGFGLTQDFSPLFWSKSSPFDGTIPAVYCYSCVLIILDDKSTQIISKNLDHGKMIMNLDGAMKPAIQAMRESVVEELVPRRGDGVSDNDQFFDRGADLNTAPAVWVSPSKEKQREEKEKDREQKRRRRGSLLCFLGFDSRPIFLKKMNLNVPTASWVWRDECFNERCGGEGGSSIADASTSNTSHLQRSGADAGCRCEYSWDHGDTGTRRWRWRWTQCSTFLISGAIGASNQKNIPLFCLRKKTFEATDFLFLTLVSRWQLTKFLDIGSCGPQVLKSMRHMENQKREVDI